MIDMIVSKYLGFSRSTAPTLEPLSEYKQQKEDEIEILLKKMEKNRRLAMEGFKKNRQKFDEHFDIDELVKHLILGGKEKVCP